MIVCYLWALRQYLGLGAFFVYGAMAQLINESIIYERRVRGGGASILMDGQHNSREGSPISIRVDPPCFLVTYLKVRVDKFTAVDLACRLEE